MRIHTKALDLVVSDKIFPVYPIYAYVTPYKYPLKSFCYGGVDQYK